MSDLTEFLLARIAEDEAQLEPPEWFCTDSARGEGWGGRGPCPICGAYQYDGDEATTKEGWWSHVELVHPRLRAECEAKRRIVELTRGIDPYGEIDWADVVELDDSHVRVMADVLRALTLPYVDHPDYREEWRP